MNRNTTDHSRDQLSRMYIFRLNLLIRYKSFKISRENFGIRKDKIDPKEIDANSAERINSI